MSRILGSGSVHMSGRFAKVCSCCDAEFVVVSHLWTCELRSYAPSHCVQPLAGEGFKPGAGAQVCQKCLQVGLNQPRPTFVSLHVTACNFPMLIV